jgi:hypothetical protein
MTRYTDPLFCALVGIPLLIWLAVHLARGGSPWTFCDLNSARPADDATGNYQAPTVNQPARGNGPREQGGLTNLAGLILGAVRRIGPANIGCFVFAVVLALAIAIASGRLS